MKIENATLDDYLKENQYTLKKADKTSEQVSVIYGEHEGNSYRDFLDTYGSTTDLFQKKIAQTFFPNTAKKQKYLLLVDEGNTIQYNLNDKFVKVDKTNHTLYLPTAEDLLLDQISSNGISKPEKPFKPFPSPDDDNVMEYAVIGPSEPPEGEEQFPISTLYSIQPGPKPNPIQKYGISEPSTMRYSISEDCKPKPKKPVYRGNE